jgi:phosphoglycerol transferase
MYTTIGVLLLGVLGLMTVLWLKTKVVSKSHANTYTILAILIAICSHPQVIILYQQTYTTYAEAKAIESIIATEQKNMPDVDLTAFSTYFEATPVELTTTTPNNVVLIYLEGLEYTFSEADTLSDLTPNLRALEERAITFTNITQVSEASYTIAGFVASQCGIPLMAFTHGNTLEGFRDSYLSGATCLGDILKRHGYTSTYIGGADTVFAGKGTFLRTHGFDTVYGHDELIDAFELDASVVSQGWGIYDDVVIDLFKKTYDTLSQSDTPFFLSMLTLDTHPPKGYVSQTCLDAGITTVYDMPMKQAIACTDYLIGKLVEHIIESESFADTTIIIVSDHLAMNSDISPLLKPYKRTNRFHIITKETEQSYVTTSGTTLDIGTTVLPYIGFRGTIGVGQDLTNTSTPYSSTIIRNVYKDWKSDILQLWQFPIISDGIFIDPAQMKLVIDDTTYTVPAIITVDQELRSRVGFKKYLELDLFFTMLPNIQNDTLIFIIDRCRIFIEASYTNITPSLPDNFCIGLFQQDIPLSIQEVYNQIYISKEELTRFQNILY